MRELLIQFVALHFFDDALAETLNCLPEHLWPRMRRRKEYLNSALARAEVGSTYQPARNLWQGLQKGYYLPPPDCSCCRTTATGEVWTGIADALNLEAGSDGSAR